MTDIDAMIEFVLARLTDREEWAREARDLADYGVTRDWRWVRLYGSAEYPKQPPSSSIYRGAPSPEWVIADCQAKRKMIGDPGTRGGVMYDYFVMCLAASDAHHADYRDEWRP